MPGNDPFERIGVKTPSSSPLIVESNLGIEEWLVGALVVDDLLASAVPPSCSAASGSLAGQTWISDEKQWL